MPNFESLECAVNYHCVEISVSKTLKRERGIFDFILHGSPERRTNKRTTTGAEQLSGLSMVFFSMKRIIVSTV